MSQLQKKKTKQNTSSLKISRLALFACSSFHLIKNAASELNFTVLWKILRCVLIGCERPSLRREEVAAFSPRSRLNPRLAHYSPIGLWEIIDERGDQSLIGDTRWHFDIRRWHATQVRGWGGVEVTVQSKRTPEDGKNPCRWNKVCTQMKWLADWHHATKLPDWFCMFLMFEEKRWSYLDPTKLFISLDSICNSWHENTTWLGLGKDHVSLLLPPTRQENIRSSCEKTHVLFSNGVLQLSVHRANPQCQLCLLHLYTWKSAHINVSVTGHMKSQYGSFDTSHRNCQTFDGVWGCKAEKHQKQTDETSKM